eukprot:967216-Amphidinium_carterae.1
MDAAATAQASSRNHLAPLFDQDVTYTVSLQPYEYEYASAATQLALPGVTPSSKSTYSDHKTYVGLAHVYRCKWVE